MLPAVIIAVICWGGVGWASWHMAAGVLKGESLAVRGVAAGILALAFVVVTLEVLGLCGWMNRWAVCGASLALVAVVAFWQKGDASFRLSDDIRLVFAWMRQRVDDGYAVAACLAAVMIGQATLRGLKIPPLSWDSLVYHTFLPARWVQLGELAPFASAGGLDCSRAYPINLELLVAWVMLPFGTDLFINFVNPAAMLLLALASYALARELRVPPRFAVWTPVLSCFAPPLWAMITSQYADILLAATLVCGVLFFVRYARSNRWADAILAAMAFGLACGTKHTAAVITGVVLVTLFAVVLFHLGGVRRSRGVLPCVLLVGFILGGYMYVRNWVTLGNPVYPWEVKIGETVLFEGSPVVSEGVRRIPVGGASKDWEAFTFVFAPKSLSWGVPFLAILPLAIWPFFQRKDRIPCARFLVVLWMLGLIVFFAGSSDTSAMIRRGWSEATQRMFAAPMVLAACLAVSVIHRWPWPRGLVAVLPAFVLLANHWIGAYPLPLSFGESAVVVLSTVACLWMLDRHWPDRLLDFARRHRLLSAVACLILIGLFSVAAGRLDRKRNATRYKHYARTIDYHDIPRDYVEAWRLCDEPDHPHTIAYAGKRNADETTSYIKAVLRWFWYPLLGSELQNRAVYASVHEPRDLPTRPYFGGLAEGGTESIWLSNLKRHAVDRLLLIRGAQPETAWIESRPDAFELLGEWDGCLLYRVDPASWTP